MISRVTDFLRLQKKRQAEKQLKRANGSVEFVADTADGGDRPASVITDNEYILGYIKYLFQAIMNELY